MGALKQARVALPLIFFLLIFILLWRGLSLRPEVVPSPLINKAAPTFQLPILLNTNKTTTNKDFLGHVTLVNVWATWCEACAEEHAFLLQMAQKDHIFLYGIDYKDDSAAAKEWLAKSGDPYQIVAVDADGQAAIDWGVYGTPETFVLDKHGIIRYKQIGPIDEDVWETKLKPLIEKLNEDSLN